MGWASSFVREKFMANVRKSLFFLLFFRGGGGSISFPSCISIGGVNHKADCLTMETALHRGPRCSTEKKTR